jgi:hypothetical protein
MSTAAAKPRIKKEKPIPEYLIYEMVDGEPIYYRGYKDVLNKKKTPEQIMGSSALQSLLITLVIDHLSNILPKDYVILSNELGLQFTHKSWRNLDIAIYDKRTISDKSIFFSNKHIEIAPQVVIEVDTKAELTELPNSLSYFYKKTDQLLAAGVQRVIWIFTASKKHLVAAKDQKWETDNWSADVAVMDGVYFNIEQLLEAF